MNRDDILHNVEQLMQEQFPDCPLAIIDEDDDLVSDCGLKTHEIVFFRVRVEDYFNLLRVSVKKAQTWKTVEDIVTYIENEMESKNG